MADFLQGTLRPGESSYNSRVRYHEPELDGAWGWLHYNEWTQEQIDASQERIDANWREVAEGLLRNDPTNAQALHMLARVAEHEKERDQRKRG